MALGDYYVATTEHTAGVVWIDETNWELDVSQDVDPATRTFSYAQDNFKNVTAYSLSDTATEIETLDNTRSGTSVQPYFYNSGKEILDNSGNIILDNHRPAHFNNSGKSILDNTSTNKEAILLQSSGTGIVF